MNLLQLNWEGWFYGLMNGIIGGAATGGSAWVGMATAKSAGVDVPTLNWKALGVICVSGALTNLFFYLKQSPLPAIVTAEKTTQTVTSERTVTTQPAEPEKPKTP